MQVIEQGIAPIPRIFTGTCRRCGCIATFTDDEPHSHYRNEHRGVEIWSVPCATRYCRERIEYKEAPPTPDKSKQHPHNSMEYQIVAADLKNERMTNRILIACLLVLLAARLLFKF